MTQFLLSGEKVVKEGSANLWKGLEAVGGKLYLTDKGRLVHVPHRMNLQRGIVAVQLSDIIDVTTGWTKFMGIPMLKNGLFVKLQHDQYQKYVVYGREAWLAAINSARWPTC